MSNMTTGIVDPTINIVTRILTCGLYGTEVNPDFAKLMNEIGAEPRGKTTELYDKGTLVIIDDEHGTVVPRYSFRR